MIIILIYIVFDRDLEEAEDQFQTAMRSHLVNIDVLVKLHDSRLYALERNFQKELLVLQTDFHEEKNDMTTRFRLERKELGAIIETIEKEEQDRESEAKHAFEQLREEIRNRNSEDINMLRISLDAQIEELETLFETAHLNYLQQTAQRTHDFKELTQNDQKLTADIDKMRKKIDTLQTSIQQWRAKIKQLTRETEERNRLLLEEKRSIQKHYQLLKQRIEIYRGTQNQGLLHLSQSANKCKAALEGNLELARRVIHLSELSRRMETIQEQVLPFAHGPNNEVDASSPQGQVPEVMDDEGKGMEQGGSGGENMAMSEEKQIPPVITNVVSIASTLMANLNPHGQTPPISQSSVWANISTHSADSEDGGGTGENRVFVTASERMANFHMKYNQVVLDNIAIEKERERLSYENAQLQDLISQYIDGTHLTDDVLYGDNPLLVINGRANLNSIPPVRKMAGTIQDGNLIHNTAARQHSSNY
jgi:peptidoglycan hydrolase CwlO-like protein